ncbi:DUF3592 domain-containing protein [Paraflavitalea sp. CAU 1676]|uniref:DUF3592 domain-containing protein n=1 Tax=Paraflavitalea sp. CAU 1676 TaxID=3032598 RepID=UPI0023D9EA54|nr:DUF3592 domain-containing protein [Paraflavitalea sp. CAU 1676]MDF2188925.1 DUF3592 domain-containing protein [Paraflavitalea sp. CAU 1676]
MEAMNQHLYIQLLFDILIPMIVGLWAIYYLSERIKEDKHVLRNGLPAEGIVCDFDESAISESSEMDLKYPIVRFVTQKGEWITERYYVADSRMKLGDTIKVIYDPENPSTFLVEARNAPVTTYILWSLIGAGGILWGFYQLIRYLLT